MARAENLVVSTVLAGPILPLYAAYYHFLGDAGSGLICLLGVAGVLAALALLRLCSTTNGAREVLATTIFIILLSLIYRTGGATSPSVIWLSVCPLLSTASGGARSGIRWTGLILVALAGIFAADLQDVFPTPVITEVVECVSLPELAGNRPTISVGIAQHLEYETIGQTLARADKALYDAKHAGRNRVVRAAPVEEAAPAC